jgi:excisionase family DNA binding protein
MDPSNDERPARLLTVTEVAQALRVSNMTVYRLVSAGDLPALRVGRSVRLRAADVESYLSGRLIKAG